MKKNEIDYLHDLSDVPTWQLVQEVKRREDMATLRLEIHKAIYSIESMVSLNEILQVAKKRL